MERRAGLRRLPLKSLPRLWNGFPAYPPVSLDDWQDYVSATVSHYKGMIDDWEVWNEPDSSGFLKLAGFASELRKPGVYVNLVSSAYKAAKAANPNARIVAGVGQKIRRSSGSRRSLTEEC